MNKLNKFSKYIINNIFILLIIYLFYLNNFRVCLIYNIFHIPCPGCGLSRSTLYLLKGNFIKSLEYNILTIPLILFFIIGSIWSIIDIIIGENSLNIFLSKHKILLIVLCSIFAIVSLVKNLLNPLLY